MVWKRELRWGVGGAERRHCQVLRRGLVPRWVGVASGWTDDEQGRVGDGVLSQR